MFLSRLFRFFVACCSHNETSLFFSFMFNVYTSCGNLNKCAKNLGAELNKLKYQNKREIGLGQ